MTTAHGYCGSPFSFPPLEVDVDGRVDDRLGIQYFGKAGLQPDGTWRCLANVGGALCVVEVSIRETQEDRKS